MQIAIASTDGDTVNEHFGKAERFLIYDCTEARLTLLGIQPVVPLSPGDPQPPFDPERMAATIAALKGCARVYCTRIGERPQQELERAGIALVVTTGPIADLRA